MTYPRLLTLEASITVLSKNIAELETLRAEFEEERRVILSKAFVEKHNIVKHEVWVPSSGFNHIRDVQEFLTREGGLEVQYVNKRGKWLAWKGRLLRLESVKCGVWDLESEGFAEHVPEAK